MEFNINSTEQNVWLAKLITALQGQGAQFKTWKDGNINLSAIIILYETTN